MGDFNYRIDLDNFDLVESNISNGKVIDMLKRDQFLLQRQKFPEIFNIYKEGFILFNPTYKLGAFKNEHD